MIFKHLMVLLSWKKFVIIIFSFFPTLCGSLNSNSILDFESHINSRDSDWSVEGNYIYVNTGRTLKRHLGNELLSNFNLTSFVRVMGIWCVLPDIPNHKDVSETRISIKFQSESGRMVDSISMSYYIGGGAQLFIKHHLNGPNIFTVHPPGRQPHRFVQLQIPLSPTDHFVVEGEAWRRGDFILIDRIIANYSQPSSATIEKDLSVTQITEKFVPQHSPTMEAVALSQGRMTTLNINCVPIVLLIYLMF